jgi:hypothetical protein
LKTKDHEVRTNVKFTRKKTAYVQRKILPSEKKKFHTQKSLCIQDKFLPGPDNSFSGPAQTVKLATDTNNLFEYKYSIYINIYRYKKLPRDSTLGCRVVRPGVREGSSSSFPPRPDPDC